MSLFHKMRTLLGALVHKPFAPHPEKAELDPAPPVTEQEGQTGESASLEEQEPAAVETDRVADLIEQQKRDGAD